MFASDTSIKITLKNLSAILKKYIADTDFTKETKEKSINAINHQKELCITESKSININIYEKSLYEKIIQY
jgi:hypothetical protein